ncbi:ABC transporter permease [Anaerosphaera multitolerans]|uniref:ABC transporter permease n=1 Tax=Anaerosphaera multitolerans TaxID=2487351 RepID=A0A437S9D1_9FIRM|nr:ABC transporter permease [Anaerosphaera multitolerans]RVU55464.1 ABC transporter permease [Anaerosphaera multitolerans]
MIKVKNKKVINETTLALLKYNKKRNIVATIAIVLTALMFTTIFTVGFGLNESMELERMRMVGGDFHIGFKELTLEELNKLKDHELVEDYGIREFVGVGTGPEFYGEQVEISYGDESYLEHSFIELTKGEMPKEPKEILIETQVLDMLGKPREIGQELTLNYNITDVRDWSNAEGKTDTFTVSGIFEGDELSQAHFIYLSKEYVDSLRIPENNYSLNIMTKNSRNLEGKAETIIKDSGYIPRDEGTDRTGEDIIKFGRNWAYTAMEVEGMDFSVVIAMAVLLGIIILTGYLIIYNTFNISSHLDIKIYGLMKAIGSSYKQLKGMILRQAFIISLWSIPIGLVVGYLLGNKLLPVVTEQSIIGSNFKVSSNPFIFVFTICMTLFTVYISASKPGRKVGKVSPLVAIHAEDMDKNIKRNKNKTLNIQSLGKVNAKRNKSKLILVVLSLSLSTVILNSTMILLKSPDLNKYLEDFINTDFVLAEKAFFNYRYSTPIEDEVIEYIESQPSFKEGGSIYYNPGTALEVETDQRMSIYGFDDEILKKQKLLLGNPNVDINNLKSGEIIVGVLGESDLENVKAGVGTDKYKLNDTIEIEVEGNIHQYRVVGFIQTDNTNTARFYGFSLSTNESGEEVSVSDTIVFMNMEEFGKLYKEPSRMVYQFDANDVDDMAEKLNRLTETKPTYKYDSREIQKDSLKSLENLVLLVGGLLSLIIGFIGILNFINVTMTNIISRERELSLMESIGMTKTEVIKMLNSESLHYVIYTGIIGTIFSIAVAEFLLQPVMDNLHFTVYKLSLTGVFIVLPIFLFLALILPKFVYSKLRKK